MYFLRRFDPTRFEEAFNNSPYARAFRVLPTRDQMDQTCGRTCGSAATRSKRLAASPSQQRNSTQLPDDQVEGERRGNSGRRRCEVIYERNRAVPTAVEGAAER